MIAIIVVKPGSVIDPIKIVDEWTVVQLID